MRDQHGAGFTGGIRPDALHRRTVVWVGSQGGADAPAHLCGWNGGRFGGADDARCVRLRQAGVGSNGRGQRSFPSQDGG